MIPFNQGLYLDMNNQIPLNLVPENTKYNIFSGSAVASENMNANNIHLINKNINMIQNVNPMINFPYNIPIGMNPGPNINMNKHNMLYGIPQNQNMNNPEIPSHSKNICSNNFKAQTASENTVTTYTNINLNKKNPDKNNFNKKN